MISGSTSNLNEFFNYFFSLAFFKSDLDIWSLWKNIFTHHSIKVIITIPLPNIGLINVKMKINMNQAISFIHLQV